MLRGILFLTVCAMLTFGVPARAIEPSVPVLQPSVPPAVFVFQSEEGLFSVHDYPAIERWGLSVGGRDWNHFSCGRLAEQPGTVLCLFAHSFLMGSIFANAAHVIEGGSAARDGRQGLLGIDLRIADLQRYGHAVPPVACVTGRPCLPTAEQAFLHEVLPDLVQAWQAETVLAAPWGNVSTIEHEILHGQFFSDPSYREAVWDFWRGQVRQRDRSQIIGEFSAHYRVADEELLVNEFQAYLLQTQPGSFLNGVRADLRPRLLSYLRERGLSPHLR